MKRIISSLRPLGALSDSISVTKPYLYLPVASSSVLMVSCVAAIRLVPFFNNVMPTIVEKTAGLLWLLKVTPAKEIIVPDQLNLQG